MDNLGIMLIFAVLGITIVILVLVLACSLRKNKKAQDFFKKIKDKIFWNPLVRFVI
jgi:nucleoside diphosphate kinase